MPGLELTIAFFAAALFLGVAPGPDNIFVLTQSALYGAKAGLITTCGLITGLCVHTCAVALGIAALIKTSPLAFTFLKLLGAAYLCWLAWLSFQAQAGRTDGESNPFPGYGALYRRGIIMNVTNPKVALFFLAFLPQFCMPANGPLVMQILYFGVWFMLSTLLVFGLVAILGGKLAKWFNDSPGKQLLLHKCAAVIFLGLAVLLSFSKLD